jgi:hypothetical protein
LDATDLFVKVATMKNWPKSRFHAGRRAMLVTRLLARVTLFAGLMALPGTFPTASYAQQAVAIGATDVGGHMGAMSRLHQVIFDWLDDTLAARRD